MVYSYQLTVFHVVKILLRDLLRYPYFFSHLSNLATMHIMSSKETFQLTTHTRYDGITQVYPR